jgi:peptidoglycan/LPS O-acetylase OafA/YrhL
MSWTINAGVVWSLKFEWIFYILGVPLLALGFKILGKKYFIYALNLALACIFIFGFFLQWPMTGRLLYATQFLCGAVAASLFRNQQISKWTQNKIFGWSSFALLFLLLHFQDAYNVPSILIAFVFFNAVIAGFSLFGILRWQPVLWLGDVSYGVYLMHGIVLYLCLHCLKSFQVLQNLNAVEYAGIIAVLGAVVISLASLSYLFFEKPIMNFVKSLQK